MNDIKDLHERLTNLRQEVLKKDTECGLMEDTLEEMCWNTKPDPNCRHSTGCYFNGVRFCSSCYCRDSLV